MRVCQYLPVPDSICRYQTVFIIEQYLLLINIYQFIRVCIGMYQYLSVFIRIRECSDTAAE